MKTIQNPTYVKTNISATVTVDSEAIQSADYLYENETLGLTFKNGDRYEYSKVPRFLFHGLQEAGSKGRFINRFVLSSNFSFKLA
tara:strand:- start:1171 stop:1425 length:255 start_codon:yes stop_codon:yes gene_type:complete